MRAVLLALLLFVPWLACAPAADAPPLWTPITEACGPPEAMRCTSAGLVAPARSGPGGTGARQAAGTTTPATGSAGGAATGAAGGAASLYFGAPSGNGGGGGGANAAGAGGPGGAGLRGAGGGGGGASVNGSNSGPGGPGGDGCVRLMVW